MVQGVDEQIPYSVNTGPWGGSPSNVTVVIKETNRNLLDVTSAKTSGSASVSGNIITLPTIQSLANGSSYRVEVKFVTGTKTLECYAYIDAEL